jgi:bacteriorhodopsin
MAVVKKQIENAHNKAPMQPLFGKSNYIWMGIGAAVIALGMFLMSGGKNPTDQFDYNVVYSKTRITVAPVLIILGFVIEVYAIFKKSPAKAA